MACFFLAQKIEIATRGTNSMPFLIFRPSSDACVAMLGSSNLVLRAQVPFGQTKMHVGSGNEIEVPGDDDGQG